MLKLTKTEISKDQRVLTYTARHSTPGRNGTTLDLDIEVVITPTSASARMSKIEADVSVEPDPEAALDKLASWLERTALAIRTRGYPVSIASDYPNPAKTLGD
jgi:hypothetical protein